MILCQVDKDIFYSYVETNKLVGIWTMKFQATDYFNKEGIIMATIESKSWSPNVIYKIADETSQNLETIKIILE